LLFTAPPAERMAKSIGGVAVTRIGRIVRAGKGRAAMTLVTAKGKRALEASGWEHFC
jgi:thiamine-monophosphate kinase